MVTVASIVVRTISDTSITVAFVGVTVTVVVDPTQAVVNVGGTKIRVCVCVPIVEKTVVGLGVLVIPIITVGVAVTTTVEDITLVRLITLWTATFAPEIMIFHWPDGMEEYAIAHVDVASWPSGLVLMAVQVYWCPAGSTRIGFTDSWEHPWNTDVKLNKESEDVSML